MSADTTTTKDIAQRIATMKTEGPVRTKIARERLGLSVREAAEKTELAESTIRRLERGWTNLAPNVRTLYRLAIGYGVSSDWLWGDGSRDDVVLLRPRAGDGQDHADDATAAPEEGR